MKTMEMKTKVGYVDGFVLPIPRAKLAAYKKMARIAAKVWIEHGAVDYLESLADDVKAGKLTSFPQSVKLRKGEIVVFSYISYQTKADRERVLKKVMSDPRLAKFMNPATMPFDGKRMIWGGFKPIVRL